MNKLFWILILASLYCIVSGLLDAYNHGVFWSIYYDFDNWWNGVSRNLKLN